MYIYIRIHHQHLIYIVTKAVTITKSITGEGTSKTESFFNILLADVKHLSSRSQFF